MEEEECIDLVDTDSGLSVLGTDSGSMVFVGGIDYGRS